MPWLIGGLFLLNVIAAVAVWRGTIYDKTQQLLQTVIVWALPVVGALVILMAWWSAREEPSRHRIVKEAPEDMSESFNQRSAVDGD